MGSSPVGSTRTRLYAFVHIANIGLSGFPIPELYNIDYARAEDAARTLAENADVILGVKVRMSENVIAQHGLEPLKRAIRACELSGVPGAKIMNALYRGVIVSGAPTVLMPPCSSSLVAPRPNTTGAMTPATATRSAGRPTRIILGTVLSRPTEKMRMSSRPHQKMGME